MNIKSSFSDRVLAWFEQHGRKNLPWQQNVTAYRVWISEIMLQQTQVTTVIPYFQKFMAIFPDVITLANASQDQVLQHWSGLGYYARARNLHYTAKIIRDKYNGYFPATLIEVEALKGIGKSTAGAILSLAFNQSHAILDGNVRRVLSRYHAIHGWTGQAKIQKTLWQYAKQHLPQKHHAEYTQAMMDLGATVCTRIKPSCTKCPLRKTCSACIAGNTTKYPTPKPKKKLPHKTVIMLLLSRINDTDQIILLLKRPAIGIWGGLWSLPEFETKTQADEWLQQHYQTSFTLAKKQISINHTFTHFHLKIHAFKLKIKRIEARVMEQNRQLWYNITTTLTGGIATPVKKILTSYMENNHE